MRGAYIATDSRILNPEIVVGAIDPLDRDRAII
jgi:hypothetical protein